MFLFVGSEYINLDAIARCGFATGPNGQYTATIHFSKSGGADRHFCYGDEAKKLEEVLKKLEHGYIDMSVKLAKKPVKKKK